MPDFRLPDLGEGLTEAHILTWHVAEGDEVHVDQVVVEVETAKASVEVPIPFAGRVTALHGAPGSLIAVGAPLISVEAAPTPAADSSEYSGNVLIGYGTREPSRRRRGRSRSGGRAAADVVSAPAAANGRIAVVSPLVRRIARENKVDLAGLRGSGPNGLVMRRDVEQVLDSPVARSSDERRIPLTGVRKAMADKLSRSRREIPEATVWVDVDATALLEARAAMNRGDQQPVGVLALLARFVVAGLARYPELNGRVERDEIVLPSAVQLGFAAQTPRGLVVPVVQNAHTLSTRQLSAELSRLTAAARDGQLEPAALTGGTFTVNNYGVFGVDGSAAIINHPEVAIIGMGRIIDRPWVVDGALVVRKITQLTLAFDHRVCDGGTAGGFLRYVADCVESPVTALADL